MLRNLFNIVVYFMMMVPIVTLTIILVRRLQPYSWSFHNYSNCYIMSSSKVNTYFWIICRWNWHVNNVNWQLRNVKYSCICSWRLCNQRITNFCVTLNIINMRCLYIIKYRMFPLIALFYPLIRELIWQQLYRLLVVVVKLAVRSSSLSSRQRQNIQLYILVLHVVQIPFLHSVLVEIVLVVKLAYIISWTMMQLSLIAMFHFCVTRIYFRGLDICALFVMLIKVDFAV